LPNLFIANSHFPIEKTREMSINALDVEHLAAYDKAQRAEMLAAIGLRKCSNHACLPGKG
jgi:hypothetical protein